MLHYISLPYSYTCNSGLLFFAVFFLFCLFWQEVVSGVVVMVCKEAVQHHGIFLAMEGLVNLQLSSKSVGVFEAFYNSVKVKDAWLQEFVGWSGNSHLRFSLKPLIQHSCLMLQPIQLISSNIEVAKAGKVPPGKTEIPFEFPLNTKSNKVLYETYHGVFVNIQVSERHFQESLFRLQYVSFQYDTVENCCVCIQRANLLIGVLVFFSVHPPLWSEALPAGQRFE